jgi:hypothetical protein
MDDRKRQNYPQLPRTSVLGPCATLPLRHREQGPCPHAILRQLARKWQGKMAAGTSVGVQRRHLLSLTSRPRTKTSARGATSPIVAGRSSSPTAPTRRYSATGSVPVVRRGPPRLNPARAERRHRVPAGREPRKRSPTSCSPLPWPSIGYSGSRRKSFPTKLRSTNLRCAWSQFWVRTGYQRGLGARTGGGRPAASRHGDRRHGDQRSNRDRNRRGGRPAEPGLRGGHGTRDS